MRFSRRLYYIVSGILLILSINFAVAAPMLAQQKPDSHVDVVHMPEDAVAMLGKRAGELDKLFQDLLGDTESESFALPDESATLPSSSSQPSGPADGSMAVGNPLPSISKEPLPVSSPDRAPPDHGMMKMWLDIIGHPEGHSFKNPDESSATPPSSSPQLSGPDYGSMAVKDPLPSVSKETSQESSSGRAPTDDVLIGHPDSLSSPKRVKLPATRPSLNSQPPGPADGSIAVENPLPSVSKEPSLVSSSGGAPTDDGLMKMWLRIIGQPENLSSSKRVKKVKKPVPSISKEPSLVSSSDRAPLSAMKKWRDIMNQHKSLSSINLEKLRATRPSSTSQPPGPEKLRTTRPSSSRPPRPASVSKKIRKPIPVFVSELSVDDYMEKWRDIIKSISPINLSKSPATPSSSISQPPGPADGSTAVGKSLPSISKEPLPVSSPGYTQLEKMWFNLIGQTGRDFLEKPEKSSASGSLSSSPPRMDVQPSGPVSSTNSDSQRMGGTNTDELSATLPSSSLQSSGIADGLMDVEKQLPSSPKEPLPVSGPSSASSSDELNKLRLLPDLFDHQSFVNPEESLAARPSWASLLSGHAHGWSEQPLPEQPLPVFSPDHALPSLGPLTESGYELMDWDASHLLSGPESSTKSPAEH